jgi:RNA polymerase sigma-70 factor (ECF subfamily)
MDEDVRLMLAFAAGDEAAFDDLFRRWAAPLLRHLERMLGEAAAAEELVQESFLRVYRARERYQPDARFSTWLYTIATRLALNELRRPSRRASHVRLGAGDGQDDPPLEIAAEESPAEGRVDARRRRGALEEALAALPERQRAALWLAAVEGLSYADVARTLETTEASVKSLVHRARVTLLEKVSEHE